jgi:hypothetical protein
VFNAHRVSFAFDMPERTCVFDTGYAVWEGAFGRDLAGSLCDRHPACLFGAPRFKSGAEFRLPFKGQPAALAGSAERLVVFDVPSVLSDTRSDPVLVFDLRTSVGILHQGPYRFEVRLVSPSLPPAITGFVPPTDAESLTAVTETGEEIRVFMPLFATQRVFLSNSASCRFRRECGGRTTTSPDLAHEYEIGTDGALRFTSVLRQLPENPYSPPVPRLPIVSRGGPVRRLRMD